MLLRIFTLTCLLLLAGCATTQPQRDQVNWNQERTRLEQLTHWQLSGKMAIITPSKRAAPVSTGSRMGRIIASTSPA